MPSWLSHSLASEIHTSWIEPMPAMMNDQNLSDSFPTKVDDLLPPPVLQTNAGIKHSRRKSASFRCLAEHWAKFKRHIGTGTAPSSSSQIGESAVENNSIQRMEMAQEDSAVDEVVVDRVWSEDVDSIESHSDLGISPRESHQVNSGGSDHESLVFEGVWSLWPPLANIRWRAWPFIMEIFSSRFIDDKSEQRYTQVSQHQLISLLMAV
jgi:osomolarity two-component system sensor histidine kinase SLN1